jgi:hypothetical protein
MPGPLPRRILTLLGFLPAAVLSLCLPALAQQQSDDGPPYVTIEGQQMSYHDVLELTGYVLGAMTYFRDAVTKAPADMPKDSPFFYYAGKNAAGKPVIWMSSSVNDPNKKPIASQSSEMQREEQTAGLLASLGAGKGSPKWQSVYAAIENDPSRLAGIGAELQTAMTDMSTAIVAKSAADRKWMFANLTEGMSQAQVDAALRSHGLASKSGVVTLPGAFEPGCYFSTKVTMAFDASGRLYKMDLSQPIPDCL